MKIQSKKHRHSRMCPCKEDIKTQTSYYSPLLQKLGSGSSAKRSELLGKCDPCFIRYIGRCAEGILSSDVKLPKSKYKILNGSKKLLTRLVNPAVSLHRKRQSLKKQSGSGLFPVLGAVAASVLGHTVGSLINNG